MPKVYTLLSVRTFKLSRNDSDCIHFNLKYIDI